MLQETELVGNAVQKQVEKDSALQATVRTSSDRLPSSPSKTPLEPGSLGSFAPQGTATAQDYFPGAKGRRLPAATGAHFNCTERGRFQRRLAGGPGVRARRRQQPARGSGAPGRSARLRGAVLAARHRTELPRLSLARGTRPGRRPATPTGPGATGDPGELPATPCGPAAGGQAARSAARHRRGPGGTATHAPRLPSAAAVAAALSQSRRCPHLCPHQVRRAARRGAEPVRVGGGREPSPAGAGSAAPRGTGRSRRSAPAAPLPLLPPRPRPVAP
ncbi:putative hydro-lyase KRH_21160 [Prinia subflava]|uniref:putative hydro-lyase KRH_21160 n=1 Tax=Prinia subflava TaxID=208062 RepID=UPI002FE1B052